MSTRLSYAGRGPYRAGIKTPKVLPIEDLRQYLETYREKTDAEALTFAAMGLPHNPERGRVYGRLDYAHKTTCRLWAELKRRQRADPNRKVPRIRRVDNPKGGASKDTTQGTDRRPMVRSA